MSHLSEPPRDQSSTPLLGMFRLLSMLPFFAWPLGCRIAVWVAAAVMLAGGMYLWGDMLSDSSLEATPEAEAILLEKIGDAQQRTAELAQLRERLAKYGRAATTPSHSASSGREPASGASSAPASVSSAELLAWIEQQVLAAGVSLQRFDPIAEATHSETAHRDASLPATDAFGRSRVPARLPIARSALIEVDGQYPALYRFLHALAKTMPPLLIDVFHLRPASPAADAPTPSGSVSRTGTGSGRLTLTARIDVVGAGRFRLTDAGLVADTAGSRPSRADPFGRRGLPDMAVGARLLGVMASGRRQSALISVGQDVMLVEIGQMVGDARVKTIGEDFVTLAPVAGLPPRTLLLRSEP